MASPTPELDCPSVMQIKAEVIPAGQPRVLRGLVRDWPAVGAAQRGNAALRAYLSDCADTEPVNCVSAPPEAGGRMHYDPTLRGFNFARGRLPLTEFLVQLARLEAVEHPPALAAQGVVAQQVAPRFAAENCLDWLPPAATARLWIGNRVQVAIHSDPADNIACVVAGRRRFTLFAPELLPDLAMGPFDPTPAGTPISMADPLQPDFARYPRFRNAMDQALTAELAPGDAIFIPYHWYHHVESRDPLSMLVNFWWNEAPVDGGSPWDAMLHAIMAVRHLPPSQRRAWQTMFDHYAFLANGDPAVHLPDHAAGLLRADTVEDRAAMRQALLKSLQQER